ncbi:ribosomal L1 domain-containing protein CG13096 [Oreochromis niloticus]|uniref:ribosomal L1 domain-containing protein CG13096 n=1 Tax=Oreochromis niloticus TaxID=8128 RepID=UPI00090512FD|nr:ribosomal L1 domain-containing protein CG13096 [Oreochromis niloticus]
MDQMESGDGQHNDPIRRVPIPQLLLLLEQHEEIDAIRPMIRWLQVGLSRGVLTEESLLVLNQVILQLPQDEIDDDLPNNEEEADVLAGGIEINPPQEEEGPRENIIAGLPAREIELNPAQQAVDPIVEEIRWFWEDEGSDSDNESVPENDNDDSDADNSDNEDSDPDESDPDESDPDNSDNEDSDSGQAAPVLLPPSPVPGGSRRRPREEEDDEEEDGRDRKHFKR